MELADQFLSCISHERNQDVCQTEKLLHTLPLPKLVKAGYAITNLNLENLRVGLGGKLYMELGPDGAIDHEISRGDVKVGDIVSVSPVRAKESFQCNGVVSKVSSQQLVVSIEESMEQIAVKLYSTRLFALKTTNTITYQRMESSLRKLKEIESLKNNPIVQYLLETRHFIRKSPADNLKFHNPSLNDPQREAIKFAITNDISIIHGPPGTGKTYTLVELIQQLCERGHRVLVCGPSNISVDTILERLAKVLPGTSLIRIGHPARLLEKNLAHSLDVLSKTGDAGAILKDISKEIDQTIARIKKSRSFHDRKEGWRTVRDLRKELRQREKKVITDLILQARVVVATLHGSSSRELLSAYSQVPKLFDALIIDEVSQSLEPQCWIPLVSHHQSNIGKLILAGDNKQLPPTIKTEDDARVKSLLGTTLFDRLVKKYGSVFKQLLTIQYRMNNDIMQFPSQEMYEGKLIADSSVASQTLVDLPGVDVNEDTESPFIWYDTQGDDFPESANEDEEVATSRFNENEALLVQSHIIKLVGSNVRQEDIGVISPYSAQAGLLKRLIHEKYPQIEISTVDGFQGREKEVILLSLVRSNDQFEVGFLKDDRRLNVAITRPKKQLCVVGNMETLERSRIKFLKHWANWSEDHAEIRYPDINDIL